MRKACLGFLGAGQMAEAIARGVIGAGILKPDGILASDVAEDRREVFRSLGASVTADNAEVVRGCRDVIVAVKPQNLPTLLPEIGPALSAKHLLMTICAGCPTAQFEAASAAPVRVVRAMPNLPMRVGKGVTAICRGRHASDADLARAERLFGAAGAVVRVEERLMDAVTALSGSGPAYVYFLAEAMIEAGIMEGLPPETARALAVETIRGAGEMMSAEPVPPEELRRRVTSKGGTTEAAFRSLEESGARAAFVRAIRAAAARARELGRK